MTVSFIATTRDQCMTPVAGEPGPHMQVCGTSVIPGRTCCADCHARLYYTPDRVAVGKLEVAAKRSVRQQRMTTGPVLTGEWSY